MKKNRFSHIFAHGIIPILVGIFLLTVVSETTAHENIVYSTTGINIATVLLVPPLDEPVYIQSGPPPSTRGGGFLLPNSASDNAVTTSISPSGGEILSPDGNVTVGFSTGTVSDNIEVIYMPQSKTYMANFSVVYIFALDVYKEGYNSKNLYFDKPVAVQARYQDKMIEGGSNEKNIGLYYFNTTLDKWVAINSVVDSSTNTVMAELTNSELIGSSYALLIPISSAGGGSSFIWILAAVLGLIIFALLFWRQRRIHTI